MLKLEPPPWDYQAAHGWWKARAWGFNDITDMPKNPSHPPPDILSGNKPPLVKFSINDSQTNLQTGEFNSLGKVVEKLNLAEHIMFSNPAKSTIKLIFWSPSTCLYISVSLELGQQISVYHSLKPQLNQKWKSYLIYLPLHSLCLAQCLAYSWHLIIILHEWIKMRLFPARGTEKDPR